MAEKEKLHRYEIALYGAACALLAVPLGLYLLNEPTVDQLGDAIAMGLRYTLIPWAVLFAAFFKGRPVEIKRKVFAVFNFALIYTFCSICPLMLVNLYLGSHEPVLVSGVVIQKKAGMASGKSTITIRTDGGEVSMRLPIKRWENLTQGETISVGVRRGSLGLLYSME